MEPSTPENVPCPGDDIATYIDGELSPAEAFAFEEHLSNCSTCKIELNHQKEFLAALTASLELENDIPLPGNFTKTIIANAESRVSGLRRPRERFTAIFICVVLFIFALFAFGAEAEPVLAAVSGIPEKLLAVGSFLVRFVFNIAIGVAVVARSLFSHVSLPWTAVLAMIGLIAAALFVFARSSVRSGRTQEN